MFSTDVKIFLVAILERDWAHRRRFNSSIAPFLRKVNDTYPVSFLLTCSVLWADIQAMWTSSPFTSTAVAFAHFPLGRRRRTRRRNYTWWLCWLCRCRCRRHCRHCHWTCRCWESRTRRWRCFAATCIADLHIGTIPILLHVWCLVLWVKESR